jgi:hypothetical protein
MLAATAKLFFHNINPFYFLCFWSGFFKFVLTKQRKSVHVSTTHAVKFCLNCKAGYMETALYKFLYYYYYIILLSGVTLPPAYLHACMHGKMKYRTNKWNLQFDFPNKLLTGNWFEVLLIFFRYKFFVCLHGDKTYNSFVCGNTT